MGVTKFTDRQEKAFLKYMECHNKTEAFKYAYSTENMKPATINRCAFALFKKDKFVARLSQELQKRRFDSEITQERILEEEKCIAYLDPAQLFELQAGLWTPIAVPDLPEHVRRALKSVDVRVGKRGTTYKYKFWNKDGSLERVSKHLGLYERDNAQKAAVIQINMVQIDKK